MSSQSFIHKSKNQEIQVTLIFPEKPNEKAKQDFYGYLKDFYLHKQKKEYLQKTAISPLPQYRQTGKEDESYDS